MFYSTFPRKEKPNTTRIIEIRPGQEICIGKNIYLIIRKLRNDRIIIKFLREINLPNDSNVLEIPIKTDIE